MQFFASVSYIKPFFLILVSLCVVMFQCLSDVVLFHNLLPAMLSSSRSLSFYLSPPRVHAVVVFFVFLFFYHIVKLTPSPVTTHYAVLTKHSKYTSTCLYVYYCVAQAAAWQSPKRVVARQIVRCCRVHIEAQPVTRRSTLAGRNIWGNKLILIKC